MARSAPPQTLTITVTGGEGSATFRMSGTITRIFIDAPSETADYNYLIADSDGRVLDASKSQMTGDQLLKMREQVFENNTFWIASADEDGTYTVTIWSETDG